MYFLTTNSIASPAELQKTEDTTSMTSEGSDGNTPQLTTGLPENTISRSECSDGNTPQLASSCPSCSKNAASNPKKSTRDPPELNKALPSLGDVDIDKKNPDLPVDVLLLVVKNCEFLACYSELKNPYRCYFDGLGYVYFSDVGESQEEVKVALLRCCKSGVLSLIHI